MGDGEGSTYACLAKRGKLLTCIFSLPTCLLQKLILAKSALVFAAAIVLGCIAQFEQEVTLRLPATLSLDSAGHAKRKVGQKIAQSSFL